MANDLVDREEGINDPNGLGMAHLVAAIVTAVVGGGVFSMVGDMAMAGAHTGAVLIAWLVCGVGVFCLMMCFYGLNRYRPELTGGIFSYAREGFGKFVGFVSVYSYWVSAFFATISYTTLLFAAIGYFFPIFGAGNNIPSMIGASIIVWVCWFLVTRGVKEAASVNVVTTIAKIVPIFVVVVAIIFAFKFDPAIFVQNFWGSADSGSVYEQVISVMSVTVWVFLGIEGAVAISGRAKRSRDVGRATITAFLCILALYLMISVLSMGVMTQEELAELPNPALAGVLEAVVGPWGATLVNFGVGLSLLGSMLGYTLLSAECPREAADQGVFPTQFAQRNEKNAPFFTVTLTCAIVQFFLIVIIFSERTYQFFYGVSLSLILIPYFLSSLFFFICAVKKLGGMSHIAQGKLTFYRVIGFIGFVYSLFLIYAGGLSYFMITTILIAPGIILYAIGERQRGLPVLPNWYDKVIAAGIVVLFCISVYCIVAGIVVV
ncbi:Putative arginine/ornithine antiporter [Slackia heliotrinireducens]|uniref:Amino acid transporter n=1 Tax=Slackia heliotrinireducens (strain ATCC 29202 / DSM 20476 / NCTC 11029 / RHS 1) TaxID=471855 RepID=C7N7U5_SLAHD|nr:basic amino acid/polyamine antiporter [Slackia heliotrinireducens]ACV22980.1 amino acid transporter [Slackia heliotrinireducens DSM 20476]VEH01853.1 Putative arginine/ornithine antiporter [Slackia heliotrinireducens]